MTGIDQEGFFVAYAFSPRQGNFSNGAYHLVTPEAFRSGRLVRNAGDALCKPRKRFWGLERANAEASCAACLRIAARLAEANVSPNHSHQPH